MEMTNDFINTISDAFYDKEITLYSQDRTKDASGFIVRDVSATETIIMANVIANREKIQEEYGIKERFDLSFTCKPTEDVDVDSIISYLSDTYKVDKMIKSDSHKLVIANRWLSKL